MPRDYSFDSLKFLLISLVVFGHVTEVMLIKGVENHLALSVYTFIYSFHMPLFIFISGYFSKNITWKKWIKSTQSLLLTYLAFQTILSIPSIIDNSFSLIRFILEPNSTLWYILCLIGWRFIFCFIQKIKIPYYVILFGTLLLSLVIGWKANTPSTISRLIVFFPYFLIGYYCSGSIVERIKAVKKRYSITVLLFAFLLIYVFSNKSYLYTLYGSVPYWAAVPGNRELGIILRISVYLISTVLSMCLINLNSTHFAKLGKKTLSIYLLHAPLVYIIYRKIINQYDLNPNIFINLFVSLLIISICIWLSNFKIIQYIVNPISIFSKKRKIE